MAGSSSMGALRAAELWPYGMRGVGEVFRLYRDLVVTGDDEVAVIHCSADDGYRALSEPLVNIRIALREAHEAGAITADERRACSPWPGRFHSGPGDSGCLTGSPVMSSGRTRPTVSPPGTVPMPGTSRPTTPGCFSAWRRPTIRNCGQAVAATSRSGT